MRAGEQIRERQQGLTVMRRERERGVEEERRESEYLRRFNR